MEHPIFIYALCEPTGEVRYVGKTVDPTERLRQHLGCNRNRYKRAWLSKLVSAGEKPVLKVLAKVPAENSFAEERRWMQIFIEQGADLLNHQLGGKRVGERPRGFPKRFSVPVVPLTDEDFEALLADDRLKQDLSTNQVREAVRIALCSCLQSRDLTISEAAEMLGCCTRTIRTWISDGDRMTSAVVLGSELRTDFLHRLTWEMVRLEGQAA